MGLVSEGNEMLPDRFAAEPKQFKFEPPERKVLEAIVAYDNGDLFVTGPGGEIVLESGTPVHARYSEWLEEAGIDPRRENIPLTWPEKDRLLVEVTMGVAEKDSEVRSTSESRSLRRKLRAEVREMRKTGIAPDAVKD